MTDRRKLRPESGRRSDGRFDSGNDGKPIGAVNKDRREWRAWHQDLWSEDGMRDKIRDRVLGELTDPEAEPKWSRLSMEYAYGKPSQAVDLTVHTDPAAMLTTAETELIEAEYRASFLPAAGETEEAK